MNKEKYNQIIDEAYENYSKSLIGSITFSERYKHFRVDGLEFNSGYPNYIHFTKEEFINKCKTNTEFSERWGLKIEERELSESEIWDYIHKNDIKIKHQHAVLYSHEVGSELRSSFVQTLKEIYNIPTKLITVTYKDEKIEIYE